MTDCPYCDQTFEEEAAIREHLYESHEYDTLSRIDRKRVDQYVEAHDLTATESSGRADRETQPDPEQVPEPTASGTAPSAETRWELSDVEALGTDELVTKLADHGIETTEEAFRDRATEFTSSMALSEQWEDEFGVTASGYERDFIWMAAEVLWKRWLPDVPNRERIYDFIEDGREQRQKGNTEVACDHWLTAWEFIKAVLPDEPATMSEATAKLPSVVSLEPFVRSLHSDLASAAADNPAYHEHRITFCREVCDMFPDADDELLLNFRHGIADSLIAIDRIADARAEFESLIEAYPEDPWAYKKLADSYWRELSGDSSSDDLERAVTLYEQAIAVDGPLEKPSLVVERREEIEQYLADEDK